MPEGEGYISGYLRELQIHHCWCDIEEAVKSNVVIGLSPDYRSSATELLLLMGVVSIQLDELDSGRICYLEISDISARGLEGIRFEVRDLEQGGMHISCRSVSRIPKQPVDH